MEHNYARILDLELNAKLKQQNLMTRSIEFGSDTRYKEATRSFLEESLSCMKQQKLLPNTNSVSRA